MGFFVSSFQPGRGQPSLFGFFFATCYFQARCFLQLRCLNRVMGFFVSSFQPGRQAWVSGSFVSEEVSLTSRWADSIKTTQTPHNFLSAPFFLTLCLTFVNSSE